MERKIGEIFEHDGEWYQCVEDYEKTICANCDLYNGGHKKCTDETHGNCRIDNREDGKSVCFKKIEKVREPYAEGNSIVSERMFQKYRTYEKNFFLNERDLLFTSYGDIVSIEIKQKQEDMEEKNNKLIEELDNLFKKHNIYISDSVCESMACEIGTWLAPQNNEEHSNSESIGKDLKPFDLEAAKSGKPVCTRAGRKVRIICFDAKGDKPIIAIVEAKGNKDALIEEVERYFINGHSVFEVRETNDDLMMLPEKHEGWVNIIKTATLKRNVGCLYDTREEALYHVDSLNDSYVATVKLEWEE